MKLKHYLDDAVGTKNKDRSMPGDKGKGVGEDREKAKGGRKSGRLRQPDHAARREGPRQEGDGEGERERKGRRQEAAVDGTGGEEVDCELAGGLDALMLDAFGASVLDDAARPENGMLLDDGQVDAIDSEFLERLSLGFHAAPDLTAWRSTLGLLVKRTSLSEVLEALHVGLHVLETLLANSGHSNDLVRDLLPLHRAAVEAHLSRALLATVGSRLRTAGVWTVTLSREMNFLFCAGWTERPVSLAHSVRLTPAQSAALDRWLDLTTHFLATAEADYCLGALRRQLGNLRMGYAGQTCGRAQELVADQVIPAWPIAEHTGLLDITRFLDGELLSD